MTLAGIIARHVDPDWSNYKEARLTVELEIKRFQTNATHLFRRALPDWVVAQALIKASGVIRGNEIVPEVTFMTIWQRWYDKMQKPNNPYGDRL